MFQTEVRRVLTEDRGLSDEGFYNYMSIGLVLVFLDLGFVLGFFNAVVFLKLAKKIK